MSLIHRSFSRLPSLFHSESMTFLEIASLLMAGSTLQGYGRWICKRPRIPTPVNLKCWWLGTVSIFRAVGHAKTLKCLEGRIYVLRFLDTIALALSAMNLQTAYFKHNLTTQKAQHNLLAAFKKLSVQVWNMIPHLFGIRLIAVVIFESYKRPLAGCMMVTAAAVAWIASYSKKVERQWVWFIKSAAYSAIFYEGSRSAKIESIVILSVEYLVGRLDDARK